MTPPRVFISYAWGDEDAWVEEFARRLRADRVDARLDRWELHPGDEIAAFMEEQVRESAFVLFICTPKFKAKADERKGGVGYEAMIATAEVMAKREEVRRKFIPVHRSGAWEEAAPSWLLGRYHIRLSGDPYSEAVYADILETLLGRRKGPPTITTGESLDSIGVSESAPAAAGPKVSTLGTVTVRPLPRPPPDPLRQGRENAKIWILMSVIIILIMIISYSYLKKYNKDLQKNDKITRPQEITPPAPLDFGPQRRSDRDQNDAGAGRTAKSMDERLSKFFSSVRDLQGLAHLDPGAKGSAVSIELRELLDDEDVDPETRSAAINYVGKFDVFGLDFTGLDLRGIRIENSKLQRSIFSGAILSGSTFSNANLSGANLSDLDLRGVSISKSNLQDVNLEDSIAEGVSWHDVDLSSARMMSADFRHASFVDCEFDDAKAHRADFRGVEFGASTLIKTDLREANLFGANLSFANLRSSDLRMAYLGAAQTSVHEDLGFYAVLTSATVRAIGDPKDVVVKADQKNSIVSFTAIPTTADFQNSKLSYATWKSFRQCASGSIGECLREPARNVVEDAINEGVVHGDIFSINRANVRRGLIRSSPQTEYIFYSIYGKLLQNEAKHSEAARAYHLAALGAARGSAVELSEVALAKSIEIFRGLADSRSLSVVLTERATLRFLTGRWKEAWFDQMDASQASMANLEVAEETFYMLETHPTPNGLVCPILPGECTPY